MKEFKSLFPNLPEELIEGLEKSYLKILKNFREERFEPSELNGGKFSEIVFRILEWYTDSQNRYTPLGVRINPSFEQAVTKFKDKTNFSSGIRLHIPRIILTLIDIRNKRNAHTGGEVDSNKMDSTYVLYASKWVLAELIRIFKNLEISEARKIVEEIMSKEVPLVWKVFDKKRILDTTLKTEEKILVLLYNESQNSVKDDVLIEWVEYSNASLFKNKILKKLHSKKMVEYQKNFGDVIISPKGIIEAEKILRKQITNFLT